MTTNSTPGSTSTAGPTPTSSARPTARPRPQVVELDDDGPREAWKAYEASGIGELLRGHHLCLVLSALDRLGVTGRLRQPGGVPVAEVTRGWDPHLATHVLRWLELRGVLETSDGGTVEATGWGRGLLSEESLAILGYYLDAYGELTHQTADLLAGVTRYGRDIRRDGAALGHHHAVLYRKYHADTVRHGMRDVKATRILDLGCGAGQTLIDECLRDPELRGVGLDIAPDVIELARERSAEAGLSDRLTFVVGDAFRPDTWPEACLDVDAVLALGVLHEHFRDGEDAVIDILNQFATWFPRDLKMLLVGEGELYYDGSDNDSDFYLVHTLSAQGFPRRWESWLDVIDRSALRCRRIFAQRESLPRMCYFDLVPA
jgi:SAM-dependent methyltransferase